MAKLTKIAKLTKNDIDILYAFRTFLISRHAYQKWKKYTLKTIGGRSNNLFAIGQLMLNKVEKETHFSVRRILDDENRMLTMIVHSETSFTWDGTPEKYGYWLKIKRDFLKYLNINKN